MKKSALTQTAEDYASRSSIHGIGYVFDKDLNIIDRLLWFFLVLVFSGVAAALTLNFWTQWRNEQVVTVLKDTTKLVTEVPFPALTLCGSGLHMNNVEKKLVQDFRNWRTQYKKTNTSREAIEKDMKEFMEERFQIKSSDQPINILDILDMMIAPDVDASIAANGVRENEISCKQSTGGVDDNTGCTKSCSDSRFDLTMGDNCLYLSTKAASQPEAVAACKSMGAELATITKNDQGWIKSKTERDAGVWIGLNDIEKEGTWVWQDGSSSATYTNWLTTNPRQPDGDGDCLIVLHISDAERWSDIACDKKYRYACSMEPEECSSEVLTKMLQKRTCIKPEKNNSTQDQSSNLPAIDIFLNPAKEQAKEKLIKEKKEIAKNYFKESDMKTFYPELFRILWESTLPCFEEENKEEHMLLSCELAKVEVNCSDIFTRVPTDIGMCCALNVDDSLRDSEYQTLVKEMQGEKTTLRVKSQEGSRNGLRLTLDLHSYSVSLGTLDQQHNTFKMFVGEPAQFPMMLDKSFPLQPGREHFVDLCATLVTTNGIKHISPEDRGCLFTDESDLDFYKGYTFTNCRLECGIKEAEKEHNCIPWHLPKGKHSSTCNPWTARDFMEDMRKHSAQCQQCLSDCVHISYLSTVTAAEFSSCDSRNLNLSPFCNLTSTSLAMWQPSVLETYGNQTTSYINATSGPMRINFPNSIAERELMTSLTKEVTYYNAYKKDIAIVNIFFGEPTAYEYERLPKMTWLDFISGFGGLCGLCLGISFVSVAEIIYWFSIRLCKKI